MDNFSHGDFRMNMLCSSLLTVVKQDVSDMGPCLRPEVAGAFKHLLESIKNLDRVTERFLENAKP